MEKNNLRGKGNISRGWGRCARGARVDELGTERGTGRGWGAGATGTTEGLRPIFDATLKPAPQPKWEHLYDATKIHEKIPYILYHPNFIKNPNELYQKFKKEFPFELRQVYLDSGKTYKLNRETCVFGDKDIMDAPPKIWGSNNPILPWTPELLQIKTDIENYYKDILKGQTLTVALGNSYPDGTYSIGHHPDREERGSTEFIASVSLCDSPEGERMFEYIDVATGEIIRLILGNGSLLLMLKGCQEHYTHSLPPDPNCHAGRINITLRIFRKDNYVKY